MTQLPVDLSEYRARRLGQFCDNTLARVCQMLGIPLDEAMWDPLGVVALARVELDDFNRRRPCRAN